MRFLKRLLGRDRYVLFSATSGRYFNGKGGWTPYFDGAKRYTRSNAEALHRSFLQQYVVSVILEV